MSGLRCQPGDLAVIEFSDFPANVGLLLEVLEPAPFLEGGQPCWVVRLLADGVPARVGTEDGLEMSVVDAGVDDLFIADWRLKPIRGQQEPAAITTAEPAREVSHA